MKSLLIFIFVASMVACGHAPVKEKIVYQPIYIPVEVKQENQSCPKVEDSEKNKTKSKKARKNQKATFKKKKNQKTAVSQDQDRRPVEVNPTLEKNDQAATQGNDWWYGGDEPPREGEK